MKSRHLDVHQRITDQIVATLERGAGEFHLPWHRPAGSFWRPINVKSKRRYQGVNVLSLWAAAQQRSFVSGTWGTYRQWAEIGAQVRKGETATFVVFYESRAVPSDSSGENEQDQRQSRFFAKATPVFAAEQVEGYQTEPRAVPNVVDAIAEADRFVAATGAIIHYEGDRAFYRASTDSIHLPPREKFVGTETISPTESYYATVLHELVHWTGSEPRCNRQLGQRFGLEAYAVEELIAELGAAFLCADLGISSAPRADHAAYLASWLQILKSDKRAIFTAASKASEAVAFLENLQSSEKVNPASAACVPPAVCLGVSSLASAR